VGGLFVVILIPWNFNRLNVKNIRLANNLNSVIEENSVISKKTSTNTGKVIVDNRELTLDELIFVKSEGNYLEIYQYGKKPSPILIRFTLKDLEALLNAYPNMIKTHRSYLVNSKYIERITGNAQGYQLHFSHYVVPVSRNMIAKFNSRIKLA
jgi:DNA-binding LytR/AlgR family response regulator